MMNPRITFDLTSAPLDPRITFSRAGNTATCVNSSGLIEPVLANIARFNYSPVTNASLGLLIEEQRTNLLVRSDEFQTTWVPTRASISANTIVSPDGTMNGDKLVEDATASNTHSVQQTPTLSSGLTLTVSVYAKAAERNWIRLLVNANAGADGSAYFDLTTGTIGVVSGGSAIITNAGNGWYRCTITGTTTTANPVVRVNLANANGGQTYTGNGTSGAYVWGAQLEAGVFATSYIPTTTTALTRNADVATITGANFSDWWQAGTGGASVFATPSTVSGVRPLVQFDDNTANEIIALRGNTTNPELYIVDGGTPQAQLDAGTIAANTAYSLTGWWALNDCKARLDNGAVVIDTTATIPTVTQARLGSDGTNYLNGHLASISYYNAFSSQIYTRRKNKVISNLM